MVQSNDIKIYLKPSTPVPTEWFIIDLLLYVLDYYIILDYIFLLHCYRDGSLYICVDNFPPLTYEGLKN